MNMQTKPARAATSPDYETVVLTMRQAAAIRWAVAAFDELAVDLLARPAQAEAELFAALLSVSGEQGWANEIARDLGREVLRHPAAETGQLFHLELRRVDGDAAPPFLGAAVTRYVRLPAASPLSPRANITADHDLDQGRGVSLSFAAYPSTIVDLDEHKRFLEDKALLDRADMLQRRMLTEAIAASAQSLEAQTVLVGVLTQLRNLGTQIALLQQEAAGSKVSNRDGRKTESRTENRTENRIERRIERRIEQRTEPKVTAARVAHAAPRVDVPALNVAIGKALGVVAAASPAKPQLLPLQTMMLGWREAMREAKIAPVPPVVTVHAVPKASQPPVPAVLVQAAPTQSPGVIASLPLPARETRETPVFVAARTAPQAKAPVAQASSVLQQPAQPLGAPVSQIQPAVSVRQADPVQQPVAPVVSKHPDMVRQPSELRPPQESSAGSAPTIAGAPLAAREAVGRPLEPAQQTSVQIQPIVPIALPSREPVAAATPLAVPPKFQSTTAPNVDAGNRDRDALKKTAVRAEPTGSQITDYDKRVAARGDDVQGQVRSGAQPAHERTAPAQSGKPPAVTVAKQPPTFHERVKQVAQDTGKIQSQFQQAQKKACDNGCGDKCGTAACPIVVMTNRITASYTNG